LLEKQPRILDKLAIGQGLSSAYEDGMDLTTSDGAQMGRRWSKVGRTKREGKHDS